MEDRARKAGMAPGPPAIPESLRAHVIKHSPINSNYNNSSDLNPFLSKDILVLSGAADKLVPWAHSKPFVEALVVGEKGRKRVVLQEGAGHQLTPEMHVEAATFVWEWLLKAGADGSRL